VAVIEGVAVNKTGPDQHEAEQFVGFITRKDVQEMILAETFRWPSREDIV
jgi:ABC-type glycerol-3-phosphate transport system substrate-binding protein